MSVYKRGEIYWYDFVFDGVRYQCSTKQGNRKAAGEIEDAKHTQLATERNERSEAAARFGCGLGNAGKCPECQKWFDTRHPVAAADGRELCSDTCRQARDKRATPVPTLAEFSEPFLQKMESDHANKPKTVTYYKYGMKKLLKYAGLKDAKLDQIGDELISGYSEWRSTQKKRNGKIVTVATVNREREVLRRLLHVAHDWKKIPTVPKIGRLSGENCRDRVVSHEEELAYLTAARQPLRDVATLLIDAGLRPEEAFRAQWPNVHLDAYTLDRSGKKHLTPYVYIPEGKTKYARRNVPLTARVLALLTMRHEKQGKPKDGWVFAAPTRTGRVESLKSQHRRALKDSKVNPFVLYSLRHTMLTRLGESGAEAFAIQKIAGHSSALISQRYVHPTPALIESAFDRFETYNASKTAELETGRVQ